jgi:hypothetical protein
VTGEVIVGGYTLPLVGTYQGDRQLLGVDVPEMTLLELLAEKERVRRALTEASADELAAAITVVGSYLKRLGQPTTVRHWLSRREAQIARQIKSRHNREATPDTSDDR